MSTLHPQQQRGPIRHRLACLAIGLVLVAGLTAPGRGAQTAEPTAGGGPVGRGGPASINSAEWWWLCATDCAARVEDPIEGTKLLRTIAEAQVAVGEVSLALDTVAAARATGDSMERGKRHVRAGELGRLAALQARLGDISGAQATAAGIADYPFDHARALRGVVSAQLSAGDITSALTTATSIEDLVARSVAHAEIGQAQARLGDREGALRSFRSACSVARQWEEKASFDYAWPLRECVPVFEMMASAGFVAEAEASAGRFGEPSRTNVLSRIALLQIGAGDYEGAWTTVAQMGAGDSSVVRPMAWERYREMVGDRVGVAEAEAKAEARQFAGATSIAHAVRNVETRGRALRSIADAQARAGDVEAATLIARDIVSNRYRAQAYCGIAAVQAQAQGMSNAQATFESAKEAASRITTDPNDKACAYREIAEAQAGAGDISSAQATFESAKEAASRITTDPNHKACAYREIVEAQARAGDIAGAVVTAKAIQSNEYQSSQAYRTILESLLAANRVGDAMTVLGKVTDRGEKAKACRAFGRASVKSGEPDRLLDWARSLDLPLFRISFYIGAAECLTPSADGGSR
jgi:tetratricopeptide (TPR) repeat protein